MERDQEMKECYAVVIPAYNEAATSREVATRALASVATVIVVDDSSTDGTASALDGVAVQVLRNAKNLGKAGSLWRGFEQALATGASAVITLDADGQHRPEDIPRLIAAYERNPRSLVVASRPQKRKHAPAQRYYANRFADFWIGWAAGVPVFDSQSGFRLYPADFLRSIEIGHSRAASFVFESEILITAGRTGWKIVSAPVPALYFPGGRRSHFRPVVDIVRIVRMVAWKLISRGMYPRGLIKSLRKSGRDSGGYYEQIKE